VIVRAIGWVVARIAETIDAHLFQFPDIPTKTNWLVCDDCGMDHLTSNHSSARPASTPGSPGTSTAGEPTSPEASPGSQTDDVGVAGEAVRPGESFSGAGPDRPGRHRQCGDEGWSGTDMFTCCLIAGHLGRHYGELDTPIALYTFDWPVRI
jgi:hypothetical protein